MRLFLLLALALALAVGRGRAVDLDVELALEQHLDALLGELLDGGHDGVGSAWLSARNKIKSNTPKVIMP